VERFLANEHHRANALKRGGGQERGSINVEWAEGRSYLEPSSPRALEPRFARCPVRAPMGLDGARSGRDAAQEPL
jgi:hypothetical protein